MNKVIRRKIILLSLIAVLLCVYILQLVFSGRGKVQNVNLDITPDSILIEKGNEPENSLNNIKLVYENSTWFVGEKKYLAEEFSVNGMVDSLKNIKVLGVITRAPGNSTDKYGLDKNNAIIVTGFNNEKTVRTITVGKDTTSGSQCYIQMDGKDTVYLCDSGLHEVFSKTIDELRSKAVYTASTNTIASVNVKTSDGDFTVSRNINTDLDDKKNDNTTEVENTPSWTLVSSTKNVKANDNKIGAWVSSISALKATSWASDTLAQPSSNPESEVTIVDAEKNYKITLYKIDNDDTQYLCMSNASPYLFYITKSTAQKYIKSVSELSED